MSLTVAVIGATGHIGGRVSAALIERGDRVLAVSRSGAPVGQAEPIVWDPAAGPPPREALDGVDAVVNMAGRPVAPVRWTEAAKREMRSSRVVTSRLLAEAIADRPETTLVNGSAVGYYGPSDAPVDESDGPGEDFLADLCMEWEDATEAARAAGARVVLIRTGIVLDAHAGALPPLVRLTRLFLGGPLAGGRFWFPWIHIADEVGIVLRAIDDHALSGAVNATAPSPVRQKQFARALARVLHRPAVVPTPGLAMRLALGEGAQAVLSGQPALPAAAREAGYEFQHPDVEPALRDLLTPSLTERQSAE